MVRYYVMDDSGIAFEEPDLMAWGRAMERTRRVAVVILDGVLISTVFLGLDHNYLRSGDPILFETMILGGVHDQYQERYRTRTDALLGHKHAVELVKASLKTEDEPLHKRNDHAV